MKMRKLSPVVAGTIFLCAGIAQAAPGALTKASQACGKKEFWSASDAIPKNAVLALHGMIKGEVSPAASYVDSLEYMKSAKTPEQRQFGQYWQARAVKQGGMDHLAYEQFSRVAREATQAESRGLRLAALGCVNEIHGKFPSLPLPLGPESLKAQADSPIVSEYLLNWVRTAAQQKSVSAETAFNLLKGKGNAESLARGLWSSANNQHAQTVKWLEAFVSSSARAKQQPQYLKRHVDQARLMLARAHYAQGRYETAANVYQQISRSSNYVTTMLQELSWTYLMAGRYDEAVGMATQLGAGALKTAFAPESTMVTAMALNELCQFPDSLRAIRRIEQEYRPSFDWLKQWSAAKGGSRQELYPMAIAYLTGDYEKGSMPDRVASEWLKSSTFTSLQDEVNKLYGEQESAEKFAQALTDLREELADEFDEDEKQFQVADARLAAAQQAWEQAQNAFESSSSRRQLDLVSTINLDLEARSLKMFRQIKEVAENARMIKIEIFNGASHDMIFQNAHPKYKEVAKKLDAELKSEKKRPAGQVWDWGSVKASSSKIEVWEDELGAFKADVVDNCSNKNKYLALRKSL